jgi:hypothetical protein
MNKDTGISGALAPISPAEGQWWEVGEGNMKGYIQIGVVSYHTDLMRNLPTEISCAIVWNNYPITSAFEDALKKTMLTDDMVEAVKQEAVKSAMMGYKFTLRENPAIGMDAYVVSGSVRDVCKYVTEWVASVRDDGTNVSGDDSYFDYYPDAVYVAGQLCVALNLKEVYEDLYNTLRAEGGKYGPDEIEADSLIPTWAEMGGS